MRYLPAISFYSGIAIAVMFAIYITQSAMPLWALLFMGVVGFKFGDGEHTESGEDDE